MSFKVCEYGYDLTHINVEKLKLFFNKWAINEGPQRDEKRLCWVFTPYVPEYINPIEIRLGAIPFANGLLFDTKQGTRGEGYCSYIGIKGPENFVNEFKLLVSVFGNCKDESETADFI